MQTKKKKNVELQIKYFVFVDKIRINIFLLGKYFKNQNKYKNIPLLLIDLYLLYYIIELLYNYCYIVFKKNFELKYLMHCKFI